MRLRIIAGKLGSRKIDAPDSHATHPMGDRIRTALFNILGDLTDKTILDPFAGSGALGFEAISRGAKHATLLERDRIAQKVIAKNIESLGLAEQAKLIKANCSVWSDNNPGETFDLILADPPYNDIQLSTVGKLISHLKPDGLMVLSYPGRGSAPTVNGVVVVDIRHIGNAALAFYRRSA